jgi:hypothetical protein
MDTGKINRLLHQDQPQRYRVKVGEEFKIKLPKLPLTADTEFLQLVTKSHGSDCVIEQPEIDRGEGNLLPQEITGIATKAGSKHYVIQAVDAISQEEVKGIEPLDIELEVEE